MFLFDKGCVCELSLARNVFLPYLLTGVGERVVGERWAARIDLIRVRAFCQIGLLFG